MRRLTWLALTAIGFTAATACSSDDDAGFAGTGGTGGVSAGGNGGIASGGLTASGGIASGGIASGGAGGFPTGGSSSGGDPGAGGGPSSGGVTASGGIGNSGGQTGSGGVKATCAEGYVDLCGMVQSHNMVRMVAPGASPALPPLVWDSALATLAQSWADTCPTGNNPNAKVDGAVAGENIYWNSAPDAVTQTAAVKSWSDEGQKYRYPANTCDGKAASTTNAECAHYTQLVWRATTKVGCGLHTGCGGDKNQVWVCNYLPAGNTANDAGAIDKPY